MAEQSLRDLYEERSSSTDFRRRDKAYADLQRVYDSEEGHPVGDLNFRPNLQDPTIAEDVQREAEEIVVNQVRRVVNHFAAMFAYPPRTMVMPLVLEQQQQDFAGADQLTSYFGHVLQKSNIDTLHPRVAHWVSLRGDGLYGVDWGLLGGWGAMGNLKRGVRILTFDPRYCYPLLSLFDPGGVDDMLVALQVTPVQAKEMFSISQAEAEGLGEAPRVFYYWTANEFRVAVEDRELRQFRRRHDLGFCPFRWVFGDASGKFAQSDAREVPKLQRTFNEGLLLAIDAIRKQVDGSWWYSSDMTKEIHPVPGQADPLGPNAQVGRWEIAADPQIILGVMQYLEQSIQSTTGVSPISVMGAAPQTSHVTGSAIRHQVEAAEARAEVRKAWFQGTFGRLAEYVLMVTRTQFPEEAIHYRSNEGLSRMSASQIAQYVEADAEYGGFLGLPPEQRVQIALQGLGRLWDEEYAIGNVVDLPGVTPQAMRERVSAYALEQAKAQARAQQALQEAAQGGQGAPGGPQSPQQAPGPAPAPPSRPQRPQAPSGAELRQALARQQHRNGS